MVHLASLALLALSAAGPAFATQAAPDEPLIPVPVDICALPRAPGPCRGSFPRVWFNQKTGTCENFIYGGCKGNANRFDSVAECEERCKPFDKAACLLGPYPEPQTVFCRAYIPSWTYDATTGTCVEFVYGGCGGTANIFESEKECLSKCGGVKPPVEDVCSLPRDPGPCKGACGHFYWSPKAGRCLDLGYGCCGGNANNFKTLRQCVRTCGRIRPTLG